MPNQHAVTQTKTLKHILSSALSVSPLLNKFTVSSEKVEKVVNEPKKPINKNARNSGPAENRSISQIASTPMINEPMKLTNKVPYGNERPNKP